MLSLQWEPEIIAVAVMYLAGRLCKFDIQEWTSKQSSRRWWEQFVQDVPVELLEGRNKRHQYQPPPPPTCVYFVYVFSITLGHAVLPWQRALCSNKPAPGPVRFEALFYSTREKFRIKSQIWLCIPSKNKKNKPHGNAALGGCLFRKSDFSVLPRTHPGS